MNKQLVLVEFRNTAPYLYEIQSANEITLDIVADYFTENEDFDEEDDSITFVDSPEVITL